MTVLPAVPAYAVDRPELRAMLDGGVDSPIALVVAPAGSGKTVLLAQWAASQRTADIVWIEITAADDDAVRLARRLVGELAGIHAPFGALDAPLGIAGGGLGDPLIDALAATFADTSRPVIVIFDDLHRMTNPDLIGDLWRLVDVLPPGVQFVFSTRIDLALSWSRHRLQHGLVEIRSAQLAFAAEAAASLLEGVARRPVDLATATTVVERTEGWAAGVQLAGLRLRVHARPAELIDALSESDRLAADYLGEEVLDALPEERRCALLELSVLETLTPGLVENVAGVVDGIAFLRDLEHDSLFLVPVTGRPETYRFHHLFRDFLRLRLRAQDRHAQARLLRKASFWYREHGEAGAAIDCLLAAEDWEPAVDLILKRGREVYERGETATVARWLGTVPEDVLAKRPDAVVLRGMVEGMVGRAALAEALLRSVIGRPNVAIGIQLVARAYAATGVQFHTPADQYLHDGHGFLAASESVGADVSMPDLLQITSLPMMRTIAMISIGRAHLYLGELGQARHWLLRALHSEGATYAPYRINGLGSLVVAEALAGRLMSATASADDALELARELSLLDHPATADAYLGRALIAIQRGRPQSGALALHEAHVRASSNNRTQVLWMAHAASRLIDTHGTDAAAVPPVGTPPAIVSELLLGIDNRRRRGVAVPSIRSVGAKWSISAFEVVAGLLERREIDRARSILDAVRPPDPSLPVYTVEFGALHGWLADLEGRRSASRSHLQSALTVAAPELLVHPFLRAGAAVVALVDALPGDRAGFRREIVSRFRALHVHAEDLADPLTARELQLLAYLPSRLTNADLAAQCFVSVNTVKTHMAHIYRKLDVAGRDAAIVRARDLGLLSEVDIAHLG